MLSNNSVMNWLLLLVIIGNVFLISFLALFLFVLSKLNDQKMLLQNQNRLLRLLEVGIGELKKNEDNNKLIDKLVGLIAAKDPLAFQTIQAVSSSQSQQVWMDPSDAAEYERMEGKHDSTGPISYEEDYDQFDSPESTIRELLDTIG